LFFRILIRRASWVAPQSLRNPQRASALELPWIQIRRLVKSRSETTMWGISEVRAVASASAHAAGCLVAVSVCSEKLRHTTISSSVSGRTARHERGGRTRSWVGSPTATPIWRSVRK